MGAILKLAIGLHSLPRVSVGQGMMERAPDWYQGHRLCDRIVLESGLKVTTSILSLICKSRARAPKGLNPPKSTHKDWEPGNAPFRNYDVHRNQNRDLIHEVR